MDEALVREAKRGIIIRGQGGDQLSDQAGHFLRGFGTMPLPIAPVTAEVRVQNHRSPLIH
jgi:hypothetical protein